MSTSYRRRHEVYGLPLDDVAELDGGNVKRYLRYARLATTTRSAGALIRQAKEAAKAAWRTALVIEKRDANKSEAT